MATALNIPLPVAETPFRRRLTTVIDSTALEAERA